MLTKSRSRAEMTRRARRLGLHEGLPLYFLIQEGLTLLGKIVVPYPGDGLPKLYKLTQQINPALVILDSITRFHSVDENNPQDVAALMKLLRDLTKEFGCSDLFLHHHRKAQAGVSNSPENMMRGSTDFRAAPDVHIALRGGNATSRPRSQSFARPKRRRTSCCESETRAI